MCNKTKPPIFFHKDKTRSTGLSSKCKDCMRAARRQRRKDDPKKYSADSRRWKRNNKPKEQAHKAVARAIKKGVLIKPVVCPQCGSSVKIEGHHDDYAKQLDVIWVCQRCHNKIHEAMRDNKSLETASATDIWAGSGLIK